MLFISDPYTTIYLEKQLFTQLFSSVVKFLSSNPLTQVSKHCAAESKKYLWEAWKLIKAVFSALSISINLLNYKQITLIKGIQYALE